MKYFSVPSDFKWETIDGYDILNKKYDSSKVIETYGQITVGNFFESGRSIDLLPEIDIHKLAEYIKYSEGKGIGFNYTINAPFMGNREFMEHGVLELKIFLGELYKAGVRSLTIALPTLIELVKSTGYDFKIKSSVICQITNSNKAAGIKKMGIDRIVLDESITRKFGVLRDIIKNIGDKVELIANSICFADCVNRMFHYNQISGDSILKTSKSSINYYPHRCMVKRHEDVSNMMKLSWIRPEDIKFYTEIGVKYFKLQGRHTVLNGDPVYAVECYFREHYDGNLLELLDLFSPTNKFNIYIDNKKLEGFVETFFNDHNFCKNSCIDCKYCASFSGNSIDLERNREVLELSKKFYKDFDHYSKLLESIALPSASGVSDIEIDFIL